MPVWGAAVNGSAVVAIGDSGEALGTLNAAACGQISSYANVYTSYRLLSSVMYNLGNYETEIYDKTERCNFNKIYIFILRRGGLQRNGGCLPKLSY